MDEINNRIPAFFLMYHIYILLKARAKPATSAAHDVTKKKNVLEQIEITLPQKQSISEK